MAGMGIGAVLVRASDLRGRTTSLHAIDFIILNWSYAVLQEVAASVQHVAVLQEVNVKERDTNYELGGGERNSRERSTSVAVGTVRTSDDSAGGRRAGGA
jgi:hypothetical protein